MGEKPFICQVCGKSFIRNDLLSTVRHTRVKSQLSVTYVESHLLRIVILHDIVRRIQVKSI